MFMLRQVIAEVIELGTAFGPPSMAPALEALEQAAKVTQAVIPNFGASREQERPISLVLAHTWDEPSKAFKDRLLILHSVLQRIENDEIARACDEITSKFLWMSSLVAWFEDRFRCKFPSLKADIKLSSR